MNRDTFLITWKNYPVPRGRNIFHKRGLPFTNKESCLSEMIFSMQSRHPGQTGQIRCLWACVELINKFFQVFQVSCQNNNYFCIFLLSLVCRCSIKRFYPLLVTTPMFYPKTLRRLSCSCFNESWNSHNKITLFFKR